MDESWFLFSELVSDTYHLKHNINHDEAIIEQVRLVIG